MSRFLGSIFFDLCEGGSRIADLESGRARNVHASTVGPRISSEINPRLQSSSRTLPSNGAKVIIIVGGIRPVCMKKPNC